MTEHVIPTVMVANGYASPASGGGAHAMNAFNFLSRDGFRCLKLMPSVDRSDTFVPEVKTVRYPSIPLESGAYGSAGLLFLIYWYRIFISALCLLFLRGRIYIAASAQFQDVFPFALLRSRKGRLFAVYIHHVIQDQPQIGLSRFVASRLEAISFRILRRRRFIVFTSSEAVKESLVNSHGFAQETVYTVKNGVDLSVISSVPMPGKRDFDLVFCGRLHRSKGVYDLIETVDLLRKKIPGVRLAIIGAGSEEKKLREIVSARNLEPHFSFLGFLSEREKIAAMKSSKVFLLPSREEGWGIVIGEAMACGLPVVVYRLDDILPVWGDNVLWVECFNVERFAGAAESLLLDEASFESYRRRGMEFAQSLSWENIIKGEAKILRSRLQDA